MNLHSSLKFLFASALAACCVFPAEAQTVVTEISADIQAFHGGWSGDSSLFGQPVTLDFSYDASTQTTSINGSTYTISAPLTSVVIVGGFGTGINLEPGGPGTGTVIDTVDLISSVLSVNAFTSLAPPTLAFTGDVYGFDWNTDGTNSHVDLIRDVYSNGQLDEIGSGTVELSNAGVQVQAPEIDPNSALSALTLLVGSLAVARGRKSIKMQPA